MPFSNSSEQLAMDSTALSTCAGAICAKAMTQPSHTNGNEPFTILRWLEDRSKDIYGDYEVSEARPTVRKAASPFSAHWPCGGCHSSTLFPSGSMTQANFPYSDSSIFSSTLQPSSFKTLTKAWRSSTR